MPLPAALQQPQTKDAPGYTPPGSTAAKAKRRTLAERLKDGAGEEPSNPSRIAGLLLKLYQKRKKQGDCMRCGKQGHLLATCPAAKPPAEDAVLRMKELW